MRGERKQISRKLRFFLDALLTLILLLAVFTAVSGRMTYREDTRFRLAEKADLAGPSNIIDRIDVPEEWTVGYDRMLIGDDGEEILFYAVYSKASAGSGVLRRREKTDGILLTPLYDVREISNSTRRRDAVLPLFLFADDPQAARAEVEIRLSDTYKLELTQVRGKAGPGEDFRENFFLFRIPMPVSRGSTQAMLLQDLADTNQDYPGSAEFPAVIRLYDNEGNLLETRDYTIRSRSAD
ncbi:MAG: hypothetical protein IKX47_06320 [Oscillospiraceae bacterium]|nr:hypothetical protein [Oscillospiraceae bacterium]